MADWSPTQYLKFEKERTQPAIDLVNRIDAYNPVKIIDIGCGPGNSTSVLKSRFPDAYILGIDNSPDMIEAAKKNHPDLDFMLCDVSSDLSAIDSGFDIVFSNACIQWVPDHRSLLKKLMDLLKKGGTLAVQVPINFDEPIHKIIREVSSSDKWKENFPNARVFFTLSQSEYFDILSELSENFSLWETVYFHIMKSHDDILEWYRGTGLRPYLDALEKDKQADFLNDVRERVIESYPIQKNGEIIFRFPRFFFTASK